MSFFAVQRRSAADERATEVGVALCAAGLAAFLSQGHREVLRRLGQWEEARGYSFSVPSKQREPCERVR